MQGYNKKRCCTRTVVWIIALLYRCYSTFFWIDVTRLNWYLMRKTPILYMNWFFYCISLSNCVLYKPKSITFYYYQIPHFILTVHTNVEYWINSISGIVLVLDENIISGYLYILWLILLSKGLRSANLICLPVSVVHVLCVHVKKLCHTILHAYRRAAWFFNVR